MKALAHTAERGRRCSSRHRQERRTARKTTIAARAARPWARCHWDLYGNGGRRWCSIYQRRRATIWRIDAPIAPRAITATGTGSDREGQLIEELVVEIATVGELYILHLLEQRHGTRTLPHVEQGHVRALASHVARTHIPEHWQLGHQTKPDRARRREVVVEQSGKQYLLRSSAFSPACSRRTCQPVAIAPFANLSSRDVALRQVDRAADIAYIADPVKDQDSLLPELGELAPGIGSRLTQLGKERVLVFHWVGDVGDVSRSIYLTQRDVP